MEDDVSVHSPPESLLNQNQGHSQDGFERDRIPPPVNLRAAEMPEKLKIKKTDSSHLECSSSVQSVDLGSSPECEKEGNTWSMASCICFPTGTKKRTSKKRDCSEVTQTAPLEATSDLVLQNQHRKIQILEVEVAKLKSTLRQYMDENEWLRRNNKEERDCMNEDNEGDVSTEEYLRIVNIPNTKKWKTVQKQIEKLQELFDTTINSLPDEEVTMNLALFHPTGTSLDVRIFLSDLLQNIFHRCKEIYLTQVEMAAREMTYDRKEKIVKHIDKDAPGFPERVKYLYQGLLTVGHMRTTDEERQAALLYSDVERCLRGIPEGCLAFQVKEVLRYYAQNNTFARFSEKSQAVFVNKAFQLCWKLLTSFYNPPVLDSSDVGGFYNEAYHEKYEQLSAAQHSNEELCIDGYVFPMVLFIHDGGMDVVKKGQVLVRNEKLSK